MPEVYICEIINNEKLNDFTFAVTVVCGELASTARAGQFVGINCGEGLLLRRPISICDICGDMLKFVYEIKGEGTRKLSEYVTGQKLDILGPLGNGFCLPEGDILAVGGGIGVPPLLFAAQSAKSGVTAVLGFRDSGRVIMKNEFETVCNEVYITTDDGSFGIHGAVTKPLEGLLKRGGYGVVLSCGPRAMLNGVAKLCEQYGVQCQISLEERMGCGIGACLVCACATARGGEVQMSRVCKDGPVFDAREVVWNS